MFGWRRGPTALEAEAEVGWVASPGRRRWAERWVEAW